jgi:hypothetical protein
MIAEGSVKGATMLAQMGSPKNARRYRFPPVTVYAPKPPTDENLQGIKRFDESVDGGLVTT